MLSKNRIHIPDSNEHACKILCDLLTKKEFNELVKSDSELNNFIKENKFCVNNLEGGYKNKERL